MTFALAAVLFLTLLSGDSLSGQIPVLQAAGPPAGIVSDEFNGASLDPMWTFVDPVGDSTFVLTGSQIAISVPAAVDHDIWNTGVNAARIMQPSADADFEIQLLRTDMSCKEYWLKRTRKTSFGSVLTVLETAVRSYSLHM